MKNLIELINKECATAYFSPIHYDKQRRSMTESFGGSYTPFRTIGCTIEESDTLFYLCCYPENHYFRNNPFLPRDFRGLMLDKTGHRSRTFEDRKFFVIHYGVSLRAMEKKARKIQSYQQDFNAKEFMTRFREKYGCATVIWPHFTGIGERTDISLPYLIGKQETQQEIIDFFKKDPKNVFALLKTIADSEEEVEWVNKNTNQIHIIDVIERPKELHFDLTVK